MAVAKNPMFHVQTKHIEIQQYFVCELIKDGVVVFLYYPIEKNGEDIFTKVIGKDFFQAHLQRHGVGLRKYLIFERKLRGSIRYAQCPTLTC